MGQLKLMILKWLSSSQIWLHLHLPVTPQQWCLFTVWEVRLGEHSRDALMWSPVHYVITDTSLWIIAPDDICMVHENSQLNVLCNSARLTRSIWGHNKEKEEKDNKSSEDVVLDARSECVPQNSVSILLHQEVHLWMTQKNIILLFQLFNVEYSILFTAIIIIFFIFSNYFRSSLCFTFTFLFM